MHSGSAPRVADFDSRFLSGGAGLPGRAGLRRVNEESQPIVLLVSGPPGIGKSRLRRALEIELSGLDGATTVMTARAEPLRREAALSLLALAII